MEYSTPVVSVIPIGIAVEWQKICGYNPMRAALVIGTNIAVSLQFTTDPSISTNAGLFMLNNQTPILVFDRERHGDLCVSDWYSQGAGNSGIVTVMEWIVFDTPAPAKAVNPNVPNFLKPVQQASPADGYTSPIIVSGEAVPNNIVAAIKSRYPWVWGAGDIG